MSLSSRRSDEHRRQSKNAVFFPLLLHDPRVVTCWYILVVAADKPRVKGFPSITALNRSKISRMLCVTSRRISHNSSPFVSATQRKKWDFWRAVSTTTRKEARCVSWGGVIVTSSLALGIADKIFISPWHKQYCGPGYRHKLHFYVVPLKRGGQGLKCYFRKSYSATFTAYLGFLSSSAS